LSNKTKVVLFISLKFFSASKLGLDVLHMSCHVRIEYPTSHANAKLRQTTCYLEVDKALEISTACKTLFFCYMSLIDPRGRSEGLIMQNATVPAFAYRIPRLRALDSIPCLRLRSNIAPSTTPTPTSTPALWREGDGGRERRGDNVGAEALWQPTVCQLLASL
jgi:hypothetical protein